MVILYGTFTIDLYELTWNMIKLMNHRQKRNIVLCSANIHIGPPDLEENIVTMNMQNMKGHNEHEKA